MSFYETAPPRKAGAWLPITFGVLMVFAFLVWAVAGKRSALPLTGLLQGSLFLAIPLVFGALAGLLCERSGIINIAIEGQLLGGAFLAAVVATLTGSAYAGLIAAPRRRRAGRPAAGAASRSSTWSTRSSSASCSTCWSSA